MENKSSLGNLKLQHGKNVLLMNHFLFVSSLEIFICLQNMN